MYFLMFICRCEGREVGKIASFIHRDISRCAERRFISLSSVNRMENIRRHKCKTKLSCIDTIFVNVIETV